MIKESSCLIGNFYHNSSDRYGIIGWSNLKPKSKTVSKVYYVYNFVA